MVNYTSIEAKSVLNRLKYIDSWYWTRYTINCYRGCQIGCIYCNSRNDRYFQPLKFETEIEIKQNLPVVLQKELQRSTRGSLLPDVVGISGATDPYQAAEKKHKITKQTLELFAKYKFPVHIITKSRLVKRDLEIINQIAEQNWATISITLTTTDREQAQFLEQGAPSPQQRLELIEEIKQNFPNIQVGVSATPIVPFLSDKKDQLTDLVHQVKDHKADYILSSLGLSMNNQQAQWFLNRIKEYDKSQQLSDKTSLYLKFKDLYQFTDKGLLQQYDGKEHMVNKKMREKQNYILELAKKINLATSISRWIPDDFREYNYQLAEELFLEVGKHGGRDPRFFSAMNLQNLKESIIEVPDLIEEISFDKATQELIMRKIDKKGWKKRQKDLNEFF